MPETIEQFWNFNNADLAANRLGQLTQKQKDMLAEKAKSHKNFNTAIGIIIAILFGGSLLGRVLVPFLASGLGDFIENGKITSGTFLTPLPSIFMGLFFFVVFGGVLIVVLRVVFERANRKVDTAVRRAEGKANFVWVEKQERNTSSTGSYYKTIRVLEMRIGGDTFTVHQELPNIINQGEEWIFYYTNHPFKFLSAEKIN